MTNTYVGIDIAKHQLDLAVWGWLHPPRGVKRKTGNYPIRRSGPLDRRRHARIPLIPAPASQTDSIV